MLLASGPPRPRVRGARLQRGRHDRTRVTPERSARRVRPRRRRATRGAARLTVVGERPAGAHRPQRSVPPRHRRRRRRPPDARTRAGCACSARSRGGPARPTPRSPWCSTRSTAPRTARATSRTGRSRCARSTPTGMLVRATSRTARPACGTPRSAAQGAWVDGERLQPSAVTALDRVGGRDRRAAAARPSVAPVPRARVVGALAVRRRRGQRRRVPRLPPRPAPAVGLPRRPARLPRERARWSSTPSAVSS